MRPESAATGRQLSWISIAVLAIVPLIAAGMLMGLVKQPSNDAVNAAIVNLDEPVTVAGQYTPLGRQMAAAIVDDSNEEITWTLANEDAARDGLESGEYAVVVTIPENFSAAATSFAENDAAVAEQATIDITTAENSPITDAQLGAQIARIATGSLNSMLTETYLENVFIGLNEMGEQFGTVTDAVGQMGDGAGQLADGTGQAAEGAAALADGLGQLADGGSELAAGGNQLAAGAGELTAGVNELSSGASQLGSAGSALSSGANELSSGANGLADGASQLAEGADQLLGPAGVPAFADGAKQLLQGVAPLAAGLDEVVAGLNDEEAAEQLQQLVDGANGLAGGVAEISDGIGTLSGGLTYASSQLGGLTSPESPDAQQAATAIAADVMKNLPACPDDDPICQAYAQALSGAALAGFNQGAGAGYTALTSPDGGLVAGAAQLADGASEAAEGAPAFAAGVEQIPGQFSDLADALSQMAEGANTISDSAEPLIKNADSLGAGTKTLLGGIKGFSGGANQLADGVGQFAGGVSQYTDGVSELAGGVGQLSGGASQLSSGASELAGGLGQFTSGLSEAAGQAPELVDGISQLADGAGELSDGLDTFGNELESNADQLPNYSDSDRVALAQVVASPVVAPSGVAGMNSTATAALILTGALWLGSLLAFVMVRPVPSNAIASRTSSVKLWARTLSLPTFVLAGQGVLMGVIAGVVLSLGLGTTVLLALALAALGVFFILANHALAAWLGNVGRGVSTLLLGATVAIAVSSLGSSGFGWLDSLSPMQNGFLLVRNVMAGGSGTLGLASVAVLIAAIAGAASIFAVTSRRSLSAAQFRRHVEAA